MEYPIKIKSDPKVLLKELQQKSKCSPDITVHSSKPDMTMRVPELIVEVKNEYSAKSEPIIQAMNYYYRFSYLAIKTNQQNRVYPSFLIVLFGRTIILYGAVNILRLLRGNPNKKKPHFICEPLYTLHCDSNNYNRGVKKFYKFIFALRNSIIELQEWTEKEDSYRNAVIPYRIWADRKFLSNKEDIKITTVDTKLVYLNGDFVWKITTRYGVEAHFCAQRLGISPELTLCEDMCEEWKLVRMQKVTGEMVNKCGALNIDKWNLFREKFSHFSKLFVHGDLRSVNIMFGRLPNESEDNYYVIDFDWAGEISKTFYPLSINMNEIEWCKGVAPGTEITPHHDNFFLDIIKMEYYDDIVNSNS